MTMQPEQGTPAPAAHPSLQASSPLADVEWEVIERVPGDPWTAALVVWTGDQIDGLTIPLDDGLLDAVDGVRQRQTHVTALERGAPDDAPGPAGGTTSPEDDENDSRMGRFMQGLSRSTGATQADRWLSGVPVRLQVAGGVALLLVFVVVMLVGSLR